MSTVHGIIAMLPDDIRAEVIEGEVIVDGKALGYARGGVAAFLLIDPVGGTWTLFAES